MDVRNGEKMGWIGGWIGGLAWIAIVSFVFFYQKRIPQGIIGITIAAAAFVFIFIFAPWKHPSTQYWKLMLPILFMFIPAIWWAIWALGTSKEEDYNYWTFLWLIPLLLPIFNHGKRKWNDLQDEEKKE